MNFRIVATDFMASFKNYTRNKGALFFSIAFPVILILLFGAIFSGSGGRYDLYVKNYDYENGGFIADMVKNSTEVNFPMNNFTNFYDAVYAQLDGTGIIKIKVIKDSDASNQKELYDYVKARKLKSVMVIPENYGMKLGMAIMNENASLAENMTLMLDQSDMQRNSIVMSVVSQFLGQSNLMIAGGDNFLHFNTSSIIQEKFEYIDFFVPGVIALTVMTNSVFGVIESNTKYRKNGILRKLSTTPFTRGDWILAKMLFMLFMAFVSTSAILLVGIAVWDLTFKVNIYMFILIISASFAFAGMGMIVTRFVKDEETAPAAANVITFPMMFLSGIFFPLEMMPSFLQTVAKFMPLYYVGEGLRDAMILGDASGALMNSLIILIFAAVVFAIGVAITSWKEE
ncbi:MAG: ABC transporter permease [Candidatus Thermoplasmatota archaeon]|nr:ABC transporter permease [Candidatus Thermoplasmatota archaeon]